MAKHIITRFAPSPTGLLHVGGLRTALYAFLFAKQHKGKFFLRIEDTDQSRKVEGAEENILETLKLFGLGWDNDPVPHQSQRLEMYKKNAEELLARGDAYYCFCTPERLEKVRTDQQAAKLPTRYDGHCRNLDAKKSAKRAGGGEPHVIRLKIPTERVTAFDDAVRGNVSFENALVDDQVLLKSDGFPTYHLASVVDDHEMNITHVIRGEEWLSSTPKHVRLYEAFGWDAPVFAHLPLLLNPDRSKLSKRQGDVAVTDYLAKGYLPEALLNFILLLGWNPGTDQEIFNFAEMLKQFSLERIHKAGAVFDLKKLDWLNGEYIRQLDIDELAKRVQPFLESAGITTDLKFIRGVVEVERERLKTLADLNEQARFFFDQPKYDGALLIWKNISPAETKTNLELAHVLLSKQKKWSAAGIEETLKEGIAAHQKTHGEVLWPLRVALTGQKDSPGPFEVAAALGKDETLARIERAISFITS